MRVGFTGTRHGMTDACDVLIACPCDADEQNHGGTWYTVSYARKKGKRIIIVWPNGTLTEENPC
jgi:hypothetical protein